VCFRSRIFQDGGTKACAVLISCQMTQSCVPIDKTHGLSVLRVSSLPDHFKISSRKTDVDHMSVACNDVSYGVSYGGTCIKICIVS